MVLIVSLVGCVDESSPAGEQSRPTIVESMPSPTDEQTATPTAPAGDAVTFVSVVDGDTIETSAGMVRIIGIDTPERGECGHGEASVAIGRLLSVGDPVRLELPLGQNDRDRHGRLVRYVSTEAGVDLGLMQLEAGNAIARYDSTDGYPAHPHEARYRAAQIASRGSDGSVITIMCRDEALPTIAPSTDVRWWEQYSSCAKLKKNTVGSPTGSFDRDDPGQAEIYDWFANRTGNNGDGGGDGLACE